MQEKREKKTGLGIAVIVFAVLFMGLAAWLIGKPLITFLGEPAAFRDWVADKGVLGVLAFIGMMLVQVVIALIPGEPFEIAAGYAFGYFFGTLWCMVAIVLGSALIFGLVRLFGKRLVNLFFPDKELDDLKFLNSEGKRNTVFFLLMLIPGTPKDLLTYVAGLTKIRFWHWMLIVTVARIPSVVTSVVGGSALGEEKYTFAAIVFGITVAISAIGLLIYRAILKRKQTADEKEEA